MDYQFAENGPFLESKKRGDFFQVHNSVEFQLYMFLHNNKTLFIFTIFLEAWILFDLKKSIT